MAKRSTFQYFEPFSTGELSFEEEVLVSANRSRIILRDVETGTKLVFEGEGLKAGETLLDKGRIESFKAFDNDNDAIFTFRGLKIDLGKFDGTNFLEQFEFFTTAALDSANVVIGTAIADELLSQGGKDIIRGRGGDDRFLAGAGNDIMTGGAGNDFFVFGEDMGRDTITDFDAKGGIDEQDLLGGSFNDVLSVERKGRDTVVEFDTGEQFVLLDTRPSAIDETDFRSFYL